MKITDEKLHQLCKQYGSAALAAKRKFIGLLPELFKRRLYERKGFHSIFEFSAKLCGLSQEQVRLALNLERRFEDKPALRTLLVEGEASINKLARVVSIATTENEEALAEKVKQLPRGALETLVRDEKHIGSPKPLFEHKSLHVQTQELEFSQELLDELNQLHIQGHDVNTLLLELLKERKEKTAEKKEAISREKTTSRYMSVEVQRILKEEYGEKCSINSCLRPAEEIHHTQRFSLASTHDPHYLAPLCKQHHQIAHAVDAKVQMHRANSWWVSKP